MEKGYYCTGVSSINSEEKRRFFYSKIIKFEAALSEAAPRKQLIGQETFLASQVNTMDDSAKRGDWGNWELSAVIFCVPRFAAS